MKRRPLFLPIAALVMALFCAHPLAARSAVRPVPQIVLQNGHRGDISDIVYSNDGHFVVSGSRSETGNGEGIGEIKLWAAPTGELIRDFDSSQAALMGVTSLALSPDARRLATANSSNDIALWDVATGKIVQLLKGHRGGVCAVAFVNGGRRILSVGGGSRPNGELRLWNAQTGTLEKVLAPGRGERERPDLDLYGRQILSLSSDGKTLAVYSPSGIQIWNTASWAKLRTVWVSPTGSSCLNLSPNGSVLAVSQENTQDIRLIDTLTGKTVRRLAMTGGSPNCLLWARDGASLIGGGAMGLLRWWNVRTGKVLRTIDTTPGSGDDEGAGDVQVLAPAPDGKTFALGLRLFATGLVQRDIQTGALRGDNRVMTSEPADITEITFSPDSKRLAVVQTDGTLRLWKVAPLVGSLSHSFAGPDTGEDEVRGINHIAWLAGGLVTTNKELSSVTWWSPHDIKPALVQKTARPQQLAASTQGIIVCLLREDEDEEAKISLWDADREAIGQIAADELRAAKVCRLSMTPDGKIALCLDFFDRSEPEKQKERLFVRVKIWDPKTLELVSDFNIPSFSLGFSTGAELKFSPDGSKVLIGNDYDQVLVAECPTGKVLWKAEGQRSSVFSPDGKSVFCRSLNSNLTKRDAENGVELWSRSIGTGTRRYHDLHDDKGTWLLLSPDGRTLAGKGDDGTIHLWSAEDGHLLQSLFVMPTTPQQDHSLEWIAWQPDGTYTASKHAAPFIRWRVGNTLFKTRP